ncbi:DNA-binding protein [Pseudomonas resinovorans]|uniref:DNA-binding protein n=1 Tax=Metapseudomonas resinovorans TaxID=53412 RepID=UPI00237F1526|nr:DNA-binding protein [Pseudomonas resinovorans]MDE3738563.1 DNA-binding protein [Pseudomonas resinovorans]
MPTLLSPEQARAVLDRKGMSLAQFARLHGLNKNLVSDLLNGRKKGQRGEAHRAAVLLGIKEGETASPSSPTPANQ